MTIANANSIEESISKSADEIFELKDNKFTINFLAATLINLEESEAVYAKNCITLSPRTHETFYEFFCDHILDTKSGKKTRACIFDDKDNAILTKIDRYKDENSNESFIALVNDFTRKLFGIMKTNSKVKSDGSLFIIDSTFNDDEYIVILKLDPQHGVQFDPETLTIHSIENMLPKSGEKIHKCALIKKKYIENETNLFVLDLQQRAGESSKFFMADFLGARALPNNSHKTVAALETIKTFITEKYTSISPEDIDNALDLEFVNSREVYIPDVSERILESLLPQELEDREIVISNNLTEINNIYNKRYKDFGLTLVVERDERKMVYRAKNNQIFFRYDKNLHGSEVKVTPTDDKILIEIENNSNINFKKDLK